jgi:hypothetical protein
MGFETGLTKQVNFIKPMRIDSGNQCVVGQGKKKMII